MNKKFFGLFLASAAVLSAGTLQSCKDNTDVCNETILKQNQLKEEVEAIKTKLAGLDQLNQDVQNLKQKAEDLSNAIELNSEAIDQLKNSVDDLKSDVDKLIERLKHLEHSATGITVQSVYTPAFGSFNTPFGITSNVLLGYYGEAKTALNFNGTLVGGDLVSGNMGTVYLSVDPLNVDFSDVSVDLINSKGNKVGVELTPLKSSDHEIVLGYTRAANNYLYETTATFASKDDVQLITLDGQGFKNAVKDILTVSDGINFTNIAQLVYETVNQNLSANAIQIQQEEEDRVVVSKYEISAAAVHPLTMSAFDALSNINADGVSKKIASVSNTLVSKIQKALIDKFGTNLVSFDIPKIKFGLSEDTEITATIPAGAINITISVEDEEQDKTLSGSGTNTEPIVVPIDKDQLNGVFDSATGDLDKLIADIQEYISKVNNSWTEITTGSSTAIINSAVEKLVNKTVAVAQRLSHSADPTVFVVDGNKLKRLSTIEADPTVLDNSEVEIIPSSNTLELLVPFYKKYIQAEGASFIANDTDINGQVFDGCTLKATMNVTSNDVVKITYEVVDYAGKPAKREYFVKVK